MFRTSKRRLFALLVLLSSFCFLIAFLASSGRDAASARPHHTPVVKGETLRDSDADKNRAVSIVASRVAQLQAQLDVLLAARRQVAKSAEAANAAGMQATVQAHPQSSPPLPPQQLPSPSRQLIPVIVFACCRANYLRQTLQKLSSLLPPAFRIIVSQDGSDASVAQLLQQEFPSITRLQHSTDGQSNYEKIARHYGWALRQVFDAPQPPPYALLLEDDMDIAPDFFQYFDAMYKLASTDSTVFAVSAWNDNGFAGRVKDADAVYRTDVFPGLGWMITLEIWREIGGRWPQNYWDEWMRLPEVNKGRSVLRPEMCRARTFGEQGSSAGQFFNEFLSRIELSSRAVPWSGVDVSYLRKDTYDAAFFAKARASRLVRSVQEAEALSNADARIMYSNFGEFVAIARELRIMQDEKNGMPRGSYNGVVVVRVGADASVRLFIAPTSIMTRNEAPVG